MTELKRLKQLLAKVELLSKKKSNYSEIRDLIFAEKNKHLLLGSDTFYSRNITNTIRKNVSICEKSNTQSNFDDFVSNFTNDIKQQILSLQDKCS